jgi:serine/threonine-protein kinase
MSERDKMLRVGQVLEDRYHIVSRATPQDIGTLFKAYDTQSDRLVAIFLLDRRFDNWSEALSNLIRTQRRLADLAQPALLPYDHAGEIDGQLYLVRGNVEGQTLAEMLHRAGPVGLKKALDIAIPLCDALAAAHQAGLTHGSLSPHSVLISDEGQVTVTDTGLLPALRPISAAPNQPWGRFPYVSPEQAAGGTVHPSADVYVLGLMIYEMLTGEPPFPHGDEASQVVQHLRQDPVPLQTPAPDVPLPLAQIVHKALSKEPAARYRNAGQLAHILRSQLVAQVEARQPEPARDRLVVPPPPPVPAVPQARDVYSPTATTQAGVEEPVGADWLMIALIVAALIAVLGLIPLWRTVYQRYAAPPPPTPLSYHWVETEYKLVSHHGGETGSALSQRHRISFHDAAQTEVAARLANEQWISGLGVQITVLYATCIKL